MIKSLIVEGLNGNPNSLEFKFNDDLNLFTGLNGCGKTTMLKILWFINSGNIEGLLREVNFDMLCLKCTKYGIYIRKNPNGDSFDVELNSGDGALVKKDIVYVTSYRSLKKQTKELVDSYLDLCDESIFFPTFRRIEGGFFMEDQDRIGHSSLKDALSALSEKLSTEKHQFIVSISTDDIYSLVTTELSSKFVSVNIMRENRFAKIREKIKNKQKEDPGEILRLLDQEIESIEREMKQEMEPFSVLNQLIKRIFHEKGIEMDLLGQNFILGQGSNPISSSKLSSGEKQMLSFLCYNTFSKNKLFFIDEPELSLHPDWQRLLIPTLLKQNNNNQFFIATHSPSIYAKYPDKEFIINKNKGE